MVLSLLRIFSYVLALAGLALVLPLAAAVRYGEIRAAWSFAVPMAASIAAAVAITVVYRHIKAAPLSIRAAFVAVGGSWILLGFFGSLPLWFSGAIGGFTNCLFESISGFTTTGATVIFDVESLPRSINLWRCEMHWLGGMGVIALVVALVPLLGIGGMKLIQAETTGPEKGKLTARITNTAKVLWFIYMGFTMAQFALLTACDMGYFDALCLSFSTLGTGGFSTRNLSVGAFGNPAVEWVTFAFMILGSVNFALYYRFFTGRVGGIWRDSELRAFLGIVLVATLCIVLIQLPDATSLSETLRDSAFHVASIISSTGFMTDDYTAWRPAAQIVLLSLVVIGGCSGSTAGGVKVVRWTVLFKQLVNEFRRLVHPHGVFTLRLNGQPGRETILPYIASFIFAYFLLVLVTMLFGALAGLAPFEALTGSLSMVGNVGPAFGELGPTAHYGEIPDFLKCWYCVAMLAGRLEIFTLFILIGTVFGLRRKKAKEGRSNRGGVMKVEKTAAALVFALLLPFAPAYAGDWRFVAAEQGATNLVIASAAPGAPLEFSWKWDPHKDPNVAKDAEAFGNIDECKIVDGGRTVLACASNGGAAAIDVASCRARWYLKLAPDTAGPHSLEILPDGRVAVACSVGIDKLVFVDVSKHPFEPSKQTVKEVMDLPGGHGVVWDRKRDSLFVLGYTNLFELAYKKDSMSAVVKRRWDFSQVAVDAHGHDLVADGRGGYYMTNRTGVWSFNPDEGVFRPVMMRAHVKSYSPDAEKGVLVQVPTEKWWSDRLIVITPGGGERIVGPYRGAKFYKARWISERVKKED